MGLGDPMELEFMKEPQKDELLPRVRTSFLRRGESLKPPSDSGKAAPVSRSYESFVSRSSETISCKDPAAFAAFPLASDGSDG